MANEKNMYSLDTLTKGNIWELQESDILALYADSDNNSDVTESASHYLSIIRTAFEVEEIKVDRPEIIAKYEARGMVIGSLVLENNGKKVKCGIKKRPILRVTDLTYENIRHISAAKLLEVIDRNFGGGWDSLSQSIKDIIESGFDISTTSLPKDRLYKPGGLYEKKKEDGFDVLEIAKGTWVEAIFAKVKPKTMKLKSTFDSSYEDEDIDDDSDVEIKDDYYNSQDDDDDYDEDKLTEESYRTTIEDNPEDLGLEAEGIGDDDYEE